jgi:hypothetical protein
LESAKLGPIPPQIFSTFQFMKDGQGGPFSLERKGGSGPYFLLWIGCESDSEVEMNFQQVISRHPWPLNQGLAISDTKQTQRWLFEFSFPA